MRHSTTALFVLSTATIIATTSTTHAFVPAFCSTSTVSKPSIRSQTATTTTALRASESFQRSLLKARITNNHRSTNEVAVAAAEDSPPESGSNDGASSSLSVSEARIANYNSINSIDRKTRGSVSVASSPSSSSPSYSFQSSLLAARIANDRAADELAVGAAETLLQESEDAEDAAMFAAAEALFAVVELGDTVELTPVVVEEDEEEEVVESAGEESTVEALLQESEDAEDAAMFAAAEALSAVVELGDTVELTPVIVEEVEALLQASEDAEDASMLAAAEALSAVVELGDTVELTPVVVEEEEAPVEEIESVEAKAPEETIPVPTPVSAEFAGVPRKRAITNINENSMQFTAGLLGAGLTLALGGGPILAALGAAALNYVSRKEDVEDNNAGKKVVDAASQTALKAYNYIASSEVAAPVVKSFQDLSDDYDIVNRAGTVLNSVGDLIEVGADKVGEMNKEYGFTDRLVDAAKGLVDSSGESKQQK